MEISFNRSNSKTLLEVDFKKYFHYAVSHEKCFPNFDYRQLETGLDSGIVSMARPNNITGIQQRTFNLYWGIKQCGLTGLVGLDLGSGGVQAPFCLATDKYIGESHPDYGGKYWSQLRCAAEDVSMFGDEAFNLIVMNHALEHVSGDVADLINGEWHRILKPNGIIAVVVPDAQNNDVYKLDKDHKHAWVPRSNSKRPSWTHQVFEDEVLDKVKDKYSLVEFDTFRNDFSFNCVLRKKGANRLLVSQEGSRRCRHTPEWDWDEVSYYRLSEQEKKYYAEVRFDDFWAVDRSFRYQLFEQATKVVIDGGQISGYTEDNADKSIDASQVLELVRIFKDMNLDGKEYKVVNRTIVSATL